MPWTAADADKHKKGLSPAQKSKWASIANGVLKSCRSSGGSDCEGKAIRVANSKFSDDVFEIIAGIEEMTEGQDIAMCDINQFIEEAAEEIDGDDVMLAEQKKAGGSNAGKYKPSEGPFCGPSGGAPKGSYPVGTRKRAIAAIAYARHAPNPAGIKACVCRHWPSLAACKKGKKKMSHKIPMGAMRFVAPGCHAHVEFAGENEDVPMLKMTAYSGKIIKGHWYWGDLAIDLSGMAFNKDRYPILEEHNRDKKIGHTSRPRITEDFRLEIDPKKTKFLSTPAAQEFIQNSKDAFPYESSIYATPLSIERLEAGSKTEVNGFTMKGPGTIWRKCQFNEASVCVFGWDRQTQASAFSKEEVDVNFDENILSGEEVSELKIETLDELKANFPELVLALTDELKGTLSEQIRTAVKAEYEEKKTAMQGKVDEMSEQLKKSEERVLQLEKKDAIRAENDLKVKADGIWRRKLAASEVAEHLFDKVMLHVSYTKFVKDGVLDEEEFGKAIDDEIKDWESRGATATVLGKSFSEKTETGDTVNNEDKLNEDVANDLLSLAGQPQKSA